MAISIDWSTFVIDVPQADLTLISGSLYELDTDQFRKDLKALEASEAGMAFTDTHIHNTSVTVAGTTFARTIEIISPYSVEFTPDAQYSVRLVGSNNNIFDVENGILVQNQVQLISNNSAGLIEGSVSGLTADESTQLDELHQIHGLEQGTPMTATPTSRTAGNISQTVTGDGKTATTVTRDNTSP